MSRNRWVVQVGVDVETDNLCVPIPQELLDALGWGPNTQVEIKVLGHQLKLTRVRRGDAK